MPVTLNKLRTLTDEAVRMAGPRYTPGLEKGAPNIHIGHLEEAFYALALADGFRDRLNQVGGDLSRALKPGDSVSLYFRRRVRTPSALIAQIERTAQALEQDEVIDEGRRLRTLCRAVSTRLASSINDLWEQQRYLTGEHDGRRGKIEYDINHLRALAHVVEDLEVYLEGTPGKALLDNNSLLLLGSWGTGKTHFLCDVARGLLDSNRPALLVLASSLPRNQDPLEAVASQTGLASSADALLEGLSNLGKRNRCRTLFMIDAINEGDRAAWSRSVASVARKMRRYPAVGLVISCRQPFERVIFNDRSIQLFLKTEHHGFDRRELDAQLSFFKFYGLSAPQVPFLNLEFSRPLFLKLICKALKDLSNRSQKRKLREIASGQKGMTYLLEYLTRHIGKPIEKDFGLSSKTCWRILKGDTRKGLPGIAGTMAAQARTWVTYEEAISAMDAECECGKEKAGRLLERFILEGVLAEDLKWESEESELVIHFPYQRFGEHLVSRHLLDEHLNETSDEQALRRSFYSNRPLGKFFLLDRWGDAFLFEGIVSAIMLEFPERMKKSPLGRELILYLPKRCWQIRALKDVFLEGLQWRSPESFGPETDRMVEFFLSSAGSQVRTQTLEILCTLAMRASHPYHAERLSRYLRTFDMRTRDLDWSEFVRSTDDHSALERLLSWIERNPTSRSEGDATNEVKLIALTLTTTDRLFRDRATRALVALGSKHPRAFFAEVLKGLSFPDPYVPERLLAASYGISMRGWANPESSELRENLPDFARALVREMFLPGAPHATRHALTKDYALGTIAIARRMRPGCIAPRYVKYLRGDFAHIASPFRSPRGIRTKTIERVQRALHMDFENYTLGRLVPDRSNYQDNHAEYQTIKKQVMQRMFDLGYTDEFFEEADTNIARNQGFSPRGDGGKVDRYGKKYSWIAFFEMYGVRADSGILAEDRARDRTSDCDIDPSFPRRKTSWSVEMPNVFWRAPRVPIRWLREGPCPSYRQLFSPRTVDGLHGPWLLLDGFVRLTGTYSREVWTFLRALLLKDDVIGRLRQRIEKTAYLGNHRIPSAADDYYTFAGEVPWSTRYGAVLRRRDGSAKRHLDNAMEWYSPTRTSYRVEVPVHYWAWESHHSELNQVSGVKFPAPALCEHSNLRSQDASFDLRDASGRTASLYREIDGATSESHLLYMRQDLVHDYLVATGQKLVWIPWGERTFHHDFFKQRLPSELQTAMAEHANNFSELIMYDSHRPTH